MLETHQSLPFHCMQHWNSKWYAPTALVDLGLVIGLGHEHDNVCPQILHQHPPQQFNMAHTNRHHHVALQLCHCHGHPNPVHQLMHMGLFLVTV